MPSILGANTLSSGGYTVDNSCRFDNNAYMQSANTNSTNNPWTFSVWIKRAKIGAEQTLIMSYTDSNDFGLIRFGTDDSLLIGDYVNGSYVMKYETNRKFRDVSAWYHIVVSQSAVSGASPATLLYVNGVQETSFGTSNAYSQNDTQNWQKDGENFNFMMGQGEHYQQAYVCEAVWIDNTVYAASDFGEFDSDSGIWKPKDPSGLNFGTNGFYFDFADSGNLGDNEAGNSRADFSENNIAATDQSTDTCTNNFATLNPLINFNSGVFSEGNLAITFGDDTVSTIGLTSGRWYWEAQRTNTANEAHFGIGVSRGFFSATSVVSSGDRIYTRGGATFFSAVSNLSILTFGSNGGTSATVSNGDIMGFYLDLDSGTKNLTIKKNDGGTPIVDVDLTYSGEEPIFPFCRMNSGCSSSWNFGNPIAALSSANADANGYGSFEYNPTVGGVNFYAICTKNLAEYG